MELKRFNLTNNLISIVILFVASFTYLSTIEPTASFWDCGEFIASSFKLEVGHPPGNPVFQLIARFFTLFGDEMKAAVLVNAMSAMCSSLTIFFLYLTIVHLGRRIVEKTTQGLTKSNVIAIFGAGIVGALAYCFSDTFWYSAVEGEVYAMSSLFTAVVFWAILKWEEQADLPYANRWILLIAFLMGISIGVHLLNLLTIPALVFIYYYKKYEVTTKRSIIVFLISVVILAAILYGIIPFLPLTAAYIDLFSVNVLNLPMNVGASLFVLSIIAAGFWGAYYTYKKGKVLLNTILLCVSLIIIGYSTFAVVVIRSSADTPTNEYQPDNPFTLVRYIGREQYGSNPLIYGQTYASPVVDFKVPKYYNVLNGKYVKIDGPIEPVYSSNSKMLFPRMWQSGGDDSYVPFFQMYTENRGRSIQGSQYKVPTFKDNLSFFFDYQLNFMYWRYFMWNFVGRQNDLQASIPGEIFRGNWESGIPFIDNMRLGDQSEGPEYIVNSRSKNHYYFLPLILGLIGLFYQLKKDKRNWFVTMLLFFLTGIAIVIYLNQPPMQPRERDYAYAGSFYAFSIWIGLGVMWIYDLLKRVIKPEVAATIAGVTTLAIPIQMASQNWHDHDRSGRYTVSELAYNYLQTTDPNAILVTHGDNDTFPLWYAQEVEGVRTDVRVMNTSLMGMDWYIDQMQNKTYQSEPVKFTIPRTEYFYGNNDFVQIVDRFNGDTIPIKDAIEIFLNPKITIPLSDGKNHNYIAARNFSVPVNKENLKKYNIVAEKDLNNVPDTIILSIPKGKNGMSKTELMLLDFVANYEWDRPLYLLQKGADVNIGLKDYLQYEGFAYKFVPIKNPTGTSNTIAQADVDALYNRVMNVYKWNSLSDTTMNVDYQNLLTFNNLISPRDIMSKTAKLLIDNGDTLKAVEVLDKMQSVMPTKNFPLNNSVIGATLTERSIFESIETYLRAGQKQKAYKLADEFMQETTLALQLFGKEFNGQLQSFDDMQRNLYYILMLSEAFEKNGDKTKAIEYSAIVDNYIKQ